MPLYALNQVSDERCEWLVPGMLKDKVLALLKTLHQRPRSRLVPLPDFAAEFCAAAPFARGQPVDALLKAVRERTQLEVQRADFKLDQLPPHLFMNFRVVDEHGRQLGMGRDLAALKAELGGQARSAFQALAALKLPTVAATSSRRGADRAAHRARRPRRRPRTKRAPRRRPCRRRRRQRHTALDLRRAARADGDRAGASRSLIGFPALIDHGDARDDRGLRRARVSPPPATAPACGGWSRCRSARALKYLEKNIPDLPAMAAAYCALGTPDELREQIVDAGARPRLPGRPAARPTRRRSRARIDEGRARLNADRARGRAAGRRPCSPSTRAARRKLKDAKPPKDVADDLDAQLQRLRRPSAFWPTRRGRACSTCRAT